MLAVRANYVVVAFGLAACGAEVTHADVGDRSDASACTFAGFGAPTTYSTGVVVSSMFVYSPAGGVPNFIAVERNAAPRATFELFANRGNGTFALATFQGAMADFTSAVFGDFDGDGLVDIAGETPTPAGDGSLGTNGSLEIDRSVGGGAFASGNAPRPVELRVVEAA